MHKYTVLVRNQPEIIIIEAKTYKHVVYKKQPAPGQVNLYYTDKMHGQDWVFNPIFATTFDDLQQATLVATEHGAEVGIYYEMEEAS